MVRLLTFLAPGTFQTSSAIPSATYVVVGGGGAGGDAKGYGATDGGGGGAGGFVTNAPGSPYAPYGPSVSFAAPTPYAITVGDGGTINAGNQPGPAGFSRFYYNGGNIRAEGGGEGGGNPPS